jgi:2,5-diketo-D-gluconate reductase B
MNYVDIQNAHIPSIGFGTFRMPGEDVLRMIPEVLEIGYRHIDTAQIYKNEEHVGQAIAAAGAPRKEIFLTTKVWVDHYRFDDMQRSVDESLRKLQTGYVDLLLLHWPNETVPLEEQIRGLNNIAAAGKARHIGISNFNTVLMAEAVRLSERPLVMNQVEFHPYLDQTLVLKKARELGMGVTAYYGMADGAVLRDPAISRIAKSRSKSPAQIVLRWLIQQTNVVALSKTVDVQRARSNFDIFDFTLSEAEMSVLHQLAKPDGRLVSPEGLAPEWDPANS